MQNVAQDITQEEKDLLDWELDDLDKTTMSEAGKSATLYATSQGFNPRPTKEQMNAYFGEKNRLRATDKQLPPIR
jgi:hypothetical protein